MKQLGIYFVVLFTSSILFATSKQPGRPGAPRPKRLNILIEDETGGAAFEKARREMKRSPYCREGYLRTMIYCKKRFRKTKNVSEVVKYFLAYGSLSPRSWKNTKTVEKINESNREMFSLIKPYITMESSNDQNPDSLVSQVAIIDTPDNWPGGKYEM